MTINTVTKAQKADEEGKEIMRLTNMVVHEVSAVDRAANKHTFLLFKSGSDEGAELENDGKGGMRIKATKAEAEVVPAAEVPAAADTPAPTEPAAKAEPVVEAQAVDTPAPVIESLAIDDDLVRKMLEAPSTVEKVGRKVSRENEAKLREAVTLLTELVAALTESASAEKAVEKAELTKAAKKAEADAARIAVLTQELETVKSDYAAYVRTVNKARSTVPTSQVLRTDEQAKVHDDRVRWSSDLTREFHEQNAQE